MRKRFYILFVTRDSNGHLRKIQIPIYYLYVLVAGALLGMASLTGIVSSYTKMVMKVSRFDELRVEKEALTKRYTRLEQAEHEKDIQVASLGSLASEVSALYGLKQEPVLGSKLADEAPDNEIDASLGQLYVLRKSALTGVATVGISMGVDRALTMADWVRASAAPTLWPVMGRITGSFGERIDPFNGEGAFHRGVDISSGFGQPVVAPADATVFYADSVSGYGRTIILDHGRGITTLYGHLASYSITRGQEVHRGDVIGYVGQSGRSTGPHLHYEVRINGVPVNPYKYLRMTLANQHGLLLSSLNTAYMPHDGN